MPKNRGILLLLVAMSILVAGCQLVGNNGKGNIPDASSAFEGKEGLALNFFDDAPPDKIIPGSTFSIAVLLENKGAADISCNDGPESDPESCGFFLVFSKEPITDISPDTGNLKDALEKVDGKSKLLGKESYLSGGRAAMEFSASAGALGKTTTSAITVNACYPYKTFLSAPACIQTAHYTVPEKSRSCTLDTLKFSGQGAPVAVTEIEQESIISGEYVKPRFKIFVSEVGKGTVLAGDTPSLKKACKAETTSLNDIIGKVTVEEASVSGKELNCKGKTIALTGIKKKDFIECMLKEEELPFSSGAGNNIVATLNLVLSYGYQTAISKEILIEVVDSPPRIKRFSVSPEHPWPGETLSIFILAEDDNGLKEIQLLDKEGRLIPGSQYQCNDRLSCSNTFRSEKAPNAMEAYIYKAMAVDNSGKQSEISMVSGTVRDITVSIDLQQEAQANSNIQITATSTSSYSKLKLLELLDSESNVLKAQDCGNEELCRKTFTITAPSEGETSSYKVMATDSGGKQKESELKSVTGTAATPPEPVPATESEPPIEPWPAIGPEFP